MSFSRCGNEEAVLTVDPALQSGEVCVGGRQAGGGEGGRVHGLGQLQQGQVVLVGQGQVVLLVNDRVDGQLDVLPEGVGAVDAADVVLAQHDGHEELGEEVRPGDAVRRRHGPVGRYQRGRAAARPRARVAAEVNGRDPGVFTSLERQG